MSPFNCRMSYAGNWAFSYHSRIMYHSVPLLKEEIKWMQIPLQKWQLHFFSHAAAYKKIAQNSNTKGPGLYSHSQLIHWLLYTSVQWEPNSNKHHNVKSSQQSVWSGRKLTKSAWDCPDPMCCTTTRPGVVWLQQKMTELYSKWFRNTTFSVLHMESYTQYNLAFCTAFPLFFLSVGAFCKFPSSCHLFLNDNIQRHLNIIF